MEHLERIAAADRAVFYRILGGRQGPVERYVVSTPETRNICNHPELTGWRFSDGLTRGVRRALAAAPFAGEIQAVPEHQVCVLNFLRGGLNFGVRKALHEAYGMNNHASAFMSSQRFRNDEGRWGVREDMYRKLKIAPDSVLVMGDVVATGVTMANGLNVLLDHLETIGSAVRMLVFFTIGCHKVEKALTAFHERACSIFPGYRKTVVVYIEGKFKLVDSKTDLRIKIPGTDLIRKQALLTPEFELSQYERASILLERCIIYDAGSRAFDVTHYIDDVAGYWKQVEELAQRGWTLDQAIAERWPCWSESSSEAFAALRRDIWQNLDETEIHRVQSAMEELRRRIRLDEKAQLGRTAQSRIAALRAFAMS